MKLHQKVITLIVVLVLALASFGFIAGMQATHNQMTAQSISAPAQASELSVSGPSLALTVTHPGMMPNVSWNS